MDKSSIPSSASATPAPTDHQLVTTSPPPQQSLIPAVIPTPVKPTTGDGSKGPGIIEAEEKAKGGLKAATWIYYLKAIGGVTAVIALAIGFLGQTSNNITTNLWLAWWSSAYFGPHSMVGIWVFMLVLVWHNLVGQQ